jgi:hypothetical protein
MTSPATVVGTGVDIRSSGLLGEGSQYLARWDREALGTQTGRRFALFALPAFTEDTDDDIRDWNDCLAGLQEHIVLIKGTEEMLTNSEMSAYLLDRTKGVIGSLTRLLGQGCNEAVATGDERLTPRLLGEIVLDFEAETRDGATVQSDSGRASGRPARQTSRGRNTVYDR